MADTRRKSAKDVAFDKERTSFRKKIRELESELKRETNARDDEIEVLYARVKNLEDVIEQRDYEIQLLRQMTKLSKEEVDTLLEDAASRRKIAELFGTIVNFTRPFF